MNPKERLAEVRKSMKSLVAVADPTDEQVEKLDGFNKEAAKLEAQIRATEQLEKAETEEAADVERRIREAAETARAEEAAKHRRLAYVEAPHQAQYADTAKYDELTAGETALVIDVLRRNGERPSPGAFKALALKIGELKDGDSEDSLKSANYVRNTFRALTGIEATPQATADAVKAGALKAATDPMYTGGANIGADWVGTAYSSQIWDAIRANNVVFGRVPSITVPDGFSSIYIPLESTDPTWYKVAEATAADGTLKVPAATVVASQMATDKKQLTLGKLGARSMYTGEMTEDSLIPFAAQLRAQLEKSGTEVLEHVMIDGDVETSANKNINDIAGTPAGTEPFLLTDGFRKLALVTNTANSRSAGGTLTEDDYIDTLKLLGVAGLAGADPRAVAFIVDYHVHYANMKIPTVKTRDVFSAATIENGFVRRMFGYEILPAFQMHRASASTNARKAQTDGKIDLDTDADNTTGAILAVRFDQWRQAFKRRMTLETTRIANADSWEIVALVRWGLAYRDSEASAISYNVGV
jgi:hypothetical protein